MSTVANHLNTDAIRRQLRVIGLDVNDPAGWDYMELVLVSNGMQVEYHPNMGCLIVDGETCYSAAWL